MNRALVIGATGMLGSYIVEHLVAKSWCVRALVRGHAQVPHVNGVEWVLGCLEEPDSLSRAAAGCDVVFHAAALIGSGGDWEAFRRTNVSGTANVVAAARTAGARLVHVSSTAVYGSARYHDDPTSEDAALPTLPDRDVYGRSKQDAERLVLEAHARGAVWATAVRPPVMYGRRDRQFLPRVGPVFARGFFPLLEGGGATLPIVHAANVAEGAVAAATRSCAAGRVYLLANDHPVTSRDLVGAAEEGLGRRIWSPEVPKRVARAGFRALEWLLRAGGRGDLASHADGTRDMLMRGNPFTSERARRELGWEPSTLPHAGLVEAFRWWYDTQTERHPHRRASA